MKNLKHYLLLKEDSVEGRDTSKYLLIFLPGRNLYYSTYPEKMCQKNMVA
jgi:hypothetical protein